MSSVAVAVYCGSSFGNQPSFQQAAQSLGHALAEAGRPLVYGGGSKGIMGVISGSVLENGGDVTGIIPFAMVAAGGEAEQIKGKTSGLVILNEKGREKVHTIVVDTMHERKMEMAKRSCAFIALPGGYGTFEEVFEVVTWSQLGIHNKPIIVLNVNSYFEPLRQLVKNGVRDGFIQAKNEQLIQFVDGPSNLAEHGSFDWGKATVEVLDNWNGTAATVHYDWTKRQGGDVRKGEEISAT
ncbi:hypothetical protein C8Q75DRAFT_731407 [Abortiporus biennis]|nr:hypothetical protein C8Q75DRAFT_731407 [Abortiporus biennis]